MKTFFQNLTRKINEKYEGTYSPVTAAAIVAFFFAIGASPFLGVFIFPAVFLVFFVLLFFYFKHVSFPYLESKEREWAAFFKSRGFRKFEGREERFAISRGLLGLKGECQFAGDERAEIAGMSVEYGSIYFPKGNSSLIAFKFSPTRPLKGVGGWVEMPVSKFAKASGIDSSLLNAAGVMAAFASHAAVILVFYEGITGKTKALDALFRRMTLLAAV